MYWIQIIHLLLIYTLIDAYKKNTFNSNRLLSNPIQSLKTSSMECGESLVGKVLPIASDNDPILKQIASPVADYRDLKIQQLISDMIVTMYQAPGIGLAAPQVYQSLRLMVFYLPATRDDIDHVGVPETVLINPIIEPLCDDKVVDFEGCLSVPGVRGKVPRYRKIKYSGIDRNGNPIERIAEGWHARLVQHEYDHLNGVLYPELMAMEDRLLSLDEWKQLQKQ